MLKTILPGSDPISQKQQESYLTDEEKENIKVRYIPAIYRGSRNFNCTWYLCKCASSNVHPVSYSVSESLCV